MTDESLAAQVQKVLFSLDENKSPAEELSEILGCEVGEAEHVLRAGASAVRLTAFLTNEDMSEKGLEVGLMVGAKLMKKRLEARDVEGSG